MTKSRVIGKNATPFYQQLRAASDTMPKWNFYKYLIAPDGKTVTAYASTTEPTSPEIAGKIDAWLK